MSTLSPEQLKTLEQTRQGLQQLTQSLASLINSVSQNHPLPEWSHLQFQATNISHSLEAISENLTANQSLLSSLVAYPTPEFPGRTESAILTQLVRTKLEPNAADWVTQGQALGSVQNDDQLNSVGLGGSFGSTTTLTSSVALNRRQAELSPEDLKTLWGWAPIMANMQARRINWGDARLMAKQDIEVSEVMKDLQLKLDAEEEVFDEEDDEEDEDEEEEDEFEDVDDGGGGPGMGGVRRPQVQPLTPSVTPLALEDVLRFSMTGQEPKSAQRL